MRKLLLLCALLAGAAPSSAQAPPPGSPASPADGWVAELGCGACHAGVAAPTAARRRAPALDHAGLRYDPGYLFAYLRRPERVRRHIGRSRMPDFRLDEKESLALALYLSELRREGERPELSWRARLPFDRPGAAERGERLVAGELRCTTCHSVGGRGGSAAPDLALSGARLNRRWLERFLLAPDQWEPGTPMPALFVAHGGGARRDLTPDAEGKLLAVAAYLASLGQARRAAMEAQLDAARRRHPEVDARLGRRIFVALNCAGCHTRAPARGWSNAPDLGAEGARVRPEWLRSFLARPAAVRPFGHHPGSGSRMPDFRLSAEEVDTLAAYLERRVRPLAAPAPRPAPLSPFAARKAATLLRERHSCLGCHRLDGEGGRIGPDLSAVGARLRPAWVASMIANPQHTVPGTMMPRAPMPPADRALITRYLAGRTGSARAEAPLSLAETPIHLPSSGSDGAALYGRFCAACHGAAGGGDGYNARFLPVRPTAHADPSYMATRPDDTLFDGIAAGGAVLARSHRMPAFGRTLGGARVAGLVAYLRTLCDCRAPDWSRDGAAGEER